MSTDVLGRIIEQAIGWLMILVFVLILCGMIMTLVRNILKMAFGQVDEDEESTAKPKFKAKREPGRDAAVNDVEEVEAFKTRTAMARSVTASEIDDFDPSSLDESDDIAVSHKPVAKVLPVAKSSTEDIMADRLAVEFDAQQMSAAQANA